MDDYTHYTMTFLIESKDEVPGKLKEYIERVEVHWNKRTEKLRCNNERKYVNSKVTSWCEKKGIELNKTVPYTPQLNRTAERLNRTLLNKIRAQLFDSGLKKEM